MEDTLVANWIVDLMLILAAGLLSGLLCKRLGVSLLVGYLVVGAIIGGGGLGIVAQEHQEIEWVARTGALLLLFSIGMEFSLGELKRLSRYFLIGGSVQMLLAALPVIITLPLLGWNWKAALMIGAATSLSSTVLVFKALAENGQLETAHGKRAIAILLFQDVAIVPLMLVMPILTGAEATGFSSVAILTANTAVFLTSVLLVRQSISSLVAPLLVRLRSVELVVLFALTVLGMGIGGADAAGLPPALGALAAGFVLGGNRLSGQIDALVLPFRETFAAVFFVSLGTLLRPVIFLEQPLLLVVGFLAVLTIKTLAGSVALRCTGLSWRAGLGMGLGLAQMGEFSFVLFSEALHQGLITAEDYNRVLFVALCTLVATPELLARGVRWSSAALKLDSEKFEAAEAIGLQVPIAVIIGGGRLGSHAAAELSQRGCDIRVIDTSPVNLHSFAQAGYRTTSGDASCAEVLARVDIQQAGIVMVFVSHDPSALQIVQAIREQNEAASILVRCRYHDNIIGLKQAGGSTIICDETEATYAIERLLSVLTIDANQHRLADPKVA